MSLVRAEALSKVYDSGGVPVRAVNDVRFAIEPGSFVAFIGPSDSGKTTLLNMVDANCLGINRRCPNERGLRAQ
jgi:putative ABC transport system ATP-binding protein